MIVVVDDRIEVGRAYVAGFIRAGVAASALPFDQFVGWFAAITAADRAAIETIVLGGEGDRMATLRLILRRSRAAVIALNDQRCLDETLRLLAAGCDDVVVKPVHVRELLARADRIHARRLDPSVRQDVDGLRIFPDGRDPEVLGRALPLPRRERRILECLARCRHGWITRAQIFNQVYGLMNDGIEDTVIETHISRLRKRLRLRLGRDPIQSQRFLGYRLGPVVAAVSRPDVA